MRTVNNSAALQLIQRRDLLSQIDRTLRNTLLNDSIKTEPRIVKAGERRGAVLDPRKEGDGNNPAIHQCSGAPNFYLIQILKAERRQMVRLTSPSIVIFACSCAIRRGTTSRAKSTKIYQPTT